MTKKKPTTWAERIKALRERRGLTQRQAAEQIGVALRTLISWENSHRVPGRLALRLLKTTFPEDF